jgi:hypothetical protein
MIKSMPMCQSLIKISKTGTMWEEMFNWVAQYNANSLPTKIDPTDNWRCLTYHRLASRFRFTTPKERFVFRCRLNAVVMAGLPLDVQGGWLDPHSQRGRVRSQTVTPFYCLLPLRRASFTHEGRGGPLKAHSAPIVENPRRLFLFLLVAASVAMGNTVSSPAVSD